MARRKKGSKLNFIIIVLVLVIGAWFVADYYFNVWQRKQITAPEPEAVQPVKEKETTTPAPAKTEDSNFKTKTYRDERFGFEFQYPVAIKDNESCPKLQRTEDGFSLGIFTFSVSDKSGNLNDFINEQLAGMNVEKHDTLSVDNQPAIKIDYQTTGMGWYGSATFIEHNDKFFEFGLLANEASEKCGGVDNYEDQIYQAVIKTLKFNN